MLILIYVPSYFFFFRTYYYHNFTQRRMRLEMLQHLLDGSSDILFVYLRKLPDDDDLSS